MKRFLSGERGRLVLIVAVVFLSGMAGVLIALWARW